MPMNRDELRNALLAGQDRVQNSILWNSRFMSQQDRNLSITLRSGFATDNPATDAFLDSLLPLINSMHSPMGATEEMEGLADIVTLLKNVLASQGTIGDKLKLVLAILVMALSD